MCNCTWLTPYSSSTAHYSITFNRLGKMRLVHAAVSTSNFHGNAMLVHYVLQVWPFKDPAYDLKKLTMERPAQAVPLLQEAAVQVGQQALLWHGTA
jgi:hypothetical protein